ncbi:hypothetical protein ACP70R_008889 [Stipagrostis hirtigluma subsp. patula]
MPGTMVSASTGALNSLLGKLATLAGKEYGKLKSVRKEVASLESEFSSMKALLEKLVDMDELDAQAKEWRNQVTDMSYDIEDCIDEFMHHLGKNDASTSFVNKTARLLKKLRVRHQIASKIQEIKIRVKQASERRMRYKLDEYRPKPSYVSVDPRIVAMHTEAASLVGVDVPREELAELLMGDVQEMMVVSIVGFGGLGKTTLVNQVYLKLEEQFQCHAFVSVSLKPDIPKILNKILLAIGGTLCHSGELDEIIKNIKLHLLNMSNDIWSSSAWNVIKCAFPENNCGSRVVTTTRIYDVALACCSYNRQYVYNMRPLGEEDSRTLFFSRIFGPGEACSGEFEVLSVDILKKCSGLPLAIISIASLLAGQSKVAWVYVRNSLRFMFEGNPSLEDMKRILDLSYRNLPHHLKTCMLYFGMYPEDYIIEKDDLVKQWIAEDFVGKVHGLDAKDVAGSYFNELINMSMIQPVDTDYNDEVLSCRVHDIMLDLIRVKCVEENFIDIRDDPQATMELHNNSRRVSLYYNGAGDSVILKTINGSLSQVRSVIAVTRDFLPSFLGFKYVRVLYLRARVRQKIDLTGICELFLLRYLKIVTTGEFEIPAQLWRLGYLETLVLDQKPGRVLSIPSDIVRLRQLLHLIVQPSAVFQAPINSLKSLRTLQGFDISSSSLESIKSFGELNNLSDLQVVYYPSDRDSMVLDALCYSFEKLLHSSSLKSIKFANPTPFDFHGFSTLSCFPRHIQILDLEEFYLPRIPKSISLLQELQSLQLMVTEVVPSDEDIDILAGFPFLANLYLVIMQNPKEKLVIPGTDLAFPALKTLHLQLPKNHLAFEAGAMPRLQKIKLLFAEVGWEDACQWLEPTGIVHLPASLRKVTLGCYFICEESATYSTVVRSVFNKHHPGVDLALIG